MSRIVKGLFGGKSSSEKILQRFKPIGFRTEGLSAAFDKESGTFNVERGEGTKSAIADLVRLSEERATEFRGLRADVRPGFGRLTQSRVQAIRNAGRRTVGNLRSELQKRRVLGSSFAQNQITGTEVEFAQQEERARAESFLQELALTGELIKEEFSSSIEAVSTQLNQLNFETGIASGLATNASQLINQNLIAQAEARAAQQAAAESFINNIISGGANIIAAGK